MGISEHETKKQGTTTDVWLTPLSIIEALGQFDLDPCGESYHPTATDIYTHSGLERPWYGRVWCNPPYSDVERWLQKLAEHGNGVALVFARLDTRWAQKIIPYADSVFFPKGRITFLRRGGVSPRYTSGAPSMFLSFGEKPNWGKVSDGLVWHPKDTNFSADAWLAI